ncbi:MAG TPA: aminotransferase class V-fold PLP-dependent enzyme [Candidatus Saccharimonadales bacterium]|nr:aminotransferase class V-fold PLP-dependent enzyme [Candidatus Saccharimonadales bacterium]
MEKRWAAASTKGSLMDRQSYPSLRNHPSVIHFDASAAFPLHDKVIAAVNGVMMGYVGAAGKASYDWSLRASAEVEKVRTRVADFISANPKAIHFVYSASDAARQLTDNLRAEEYDTIIYSPEDHTSVTDLLGQHALKPIHLSYNQNGAYDLNTIDSTADYSKAVIFASNIHHLYGADNDMRALRQAFPGATLVIDASQSIGRTTVNVGLLGCDALYFSSQKLGGITGAGVLFISPSSKLASIDLIEPSTLPLPAITSLGAAIDIINAVSLHHIDTKLTRLTSHFIQIAAEQVDALTFTKGSANSEYNCSGNGIVSFKVGGYSSQDIAMILGSNNINVRAADHCVNDAFVDRDVVRVSMHAYTVPDELEKLVNVLAEL